VSGARVKYRKGPGARTSGLRFELSGDRTTWICFEPDADVLMRLPLTRRLAWDLRGEQPGGPPSRDGVYLILPRKVRSPRV
jgi:hypothetical protein